MSLRHKMAPYAAGWGARRYEMAACHSRHLSSESMVSNGRRPTLREMGSITRCHGAMRWRPTLPVIPDIFYRESMVSKGRRPTLRGMGSTARCRGAMRRRPTLTVIPDIFNRESMVSNGRRPTLRGNGVYNKVSRRHEMAPYATCHSRHLLSGIHGFKREKTDTERNGVYNKVSRRHEMAPYVAVIPDIFHRESMVSNGRRPTLRGMGSITRCHGAMRWRPTLLSFPTSFIGNPWFQRGEDRH